jgi:citrate lyase subunit beta / citryl-CoA lyase
VILRSLLFAPANHARHAAKALAGTADGAILDLEDAVEVGQKPLARAALPELLANRDPDATWARVFVRVNDLSTEHAYQDLLAVARPEVHGVVLPKCESAQDVRTADWLLLQLERERGLPPRSVRLMPIVETAAGLTRVHEIAAASPRIDRLNFGAGDFSLDLGMPWHPGNEAVLWARITVVAASRAAGLAPPLDTVFPDLRDGEGLRREAEQAKRLGFVGKACIHPAQVEIVNDVFTPGAAEVDRARRVVAAFEAATREGSASIQLDGDFIDYPVAERARRVVELADRMLTREGRP